MVLLNVSSKDFLQKHNFDHFHLIHFKRLFCKILFSDVIQPYMTKEHLIAVFLEYLDSSGIAFGNSPFSYKNLSLALQWRNAET